MGENRTCGRMGFKSTYNSRRNPLEYRTLGAGFRTRCLAVLVGLFFLSVVSGCSPFYVIRAGWAQAGILRSRVPLTDVMVDPSTDEATRGKLRLVWDARAYAVGRLGFENTGDSYTSLAPLESDTLALVLSAAYPDRLAFRTWWFPIVGRVPYRAYFSTEAGEQARDELEEEGFDTYLRPTAAFSTLGWFADPLYSTLLRLDEVQLVTTVLHELAHNHLYVSGQGRFNESFATFVGHVAAIHFFCRPDEAGPITLRCQRARDRWDDAQDVSRFVDEVERAILDVYAQAPEAAVGDFTAVRNAVYLTARTEFVEDVQPRLRASTYAYFGTETLNNATLLSRSLYYHRLPDFNRLWSAWDGRFPDLLAWLRSEAPEMDDPFALLDSDGIPAP